MNTYAIIENGKVTNVIVWDGVTDFDSSMELVEILEGVGAGIGWDYIDGKFVDNRPQPEPEETFVPEGADNESE